MAKQYAEFRDLSLKIHEIEIHPISWLITQMQYETLLKNRKKSEMYWAPPHIKIDFAKFYLFLSYENEYCFMSRALQSKY